MSDAQNNAGTGADSSVSNADDMSRTSGSSDMRKFVSELLNDTWSRAVPAPSGIGLARLRKLQAFLDRIALLEAPQQSHFGPSKSLVVTLFMRLFGQQIQGTKSTIYQAMRERVHSTISSWPVAQSAENNAPPTADPPAASVDTTTTAATEAPASTPAPTPVPAPTASADDLFWQQFAAPAPAPEPVFKSILADEASLSPSDFAKAVYGELPFFLPPGEHADAIPAAKFAAMVPALRSFFQAVTGHALPASLDEVQIRARIFCYMQFKYRSACAIAGTHPRQVVRIKRPVVPPPAVASVQRRVSTSGSNLHVDLTRRTTSAAARVHYSPGTKFDLLIFY